MSPRMGGSPPSPDSPFQVGQLRLGEALPRVAACSVSHTRLLSQTEQAQDRCLLPSSPSWPSSARPSWDPGTTVCVSGGTRHLPALHLLPGAHLSQMRLIRRLVLLFPSLNQGQPQARDTYAQHGQPAWYGGTRTLAPAPSPGSQAGTQQHVLCTWQGPPLRWSCPTYCPYPPSHEDLLPTAWQAAQAQVCPFYTLIPQGW